MTVRELESEFVLGQKWAVICERILTFRDDYGTVVMTKVHDVKTEHYQTGKPQRCKYFEQTVRYIRVVNNEIYIMVNEEIQVDPYDYQQCRECDKQDCYSCDIKF